MKSKMTILKNGLRIVTVEMPDAPAVTVMVMVAAGTRYETRATNGLSHFLEHMCFKGTKKRTVREIAYELESMGALSNAFTGHDFTGYYTKGRAALFPKLLDVVSDVYLNSTFPESEIEKERGVICGEIDMTEDIPQNKIGYLFLESLYGDQPAGYPILGPKENIKRFSRADFIRYRDLHYHAGKTIVVVAGGVTHANVIAEVQKAFIGITTGAKAAKKKIANRTGMRVMAKNQKSDQAHIMIGVRAPHASHPDRTPFEIMTAVLGAGMSSRLFIKLREEMGAGYYIHADASSSDDTGEMIVATGTEPVRVPEIAAAIMGEIATIRTDRVAAHELEKVKQFLVGKMYMGLESSGAVAELVASQAIIGQPIKLPKQLEREIRAVTAADILRVAKKYLKPERFHLAMIGPGGDAKALEKLLK